MENLIKSEYFELPSTPICSFGTIHKNSKGEVESVNFFVPIYGANIINISINVLNKDLVFTINEIHLKNMNSDILFDLIGRLKNIEDNLKPKLKPYFGL